MRCGDSGLNITQKQFLVGISTNKTSLKRTSEIIKKVCRLLLFASLRVFLTVLGCAGLPEGREGLLLLFFCLDWELIFSFLKHVVLHKLYFSIIFFKTPFCFESSFRESHIHFLHSSAFLLIKET